ncbi:MAG: hypothetical protein WKF58_13370 [Ilumatobacteraceae bacterium]
MSTRARGTSCRSRCCPLLSETARSRSPIRGVRYDRSRAEPLSPEQESQAISLIRGMAMDAPHHRQQRAPGHGDGARAARPRAVLRVMKLDPGEPLWPDRDRFVLSNGHASILQYSMLFLTGLGVEIADLRAFRSYESRTPGHPEAMHTAGVEVTTGPLGQGFGDAVGMAIAERVLRDEFGAGLTSITTRSSSPATAASWRASATRRRRSPGTSGSAG